MAWINDLPVNTRLSHSDSVTGTLIDPATGWVAWDDGTDSLVDPEGNYLSVVND